MNKKKDSETEGSSTEASLLNKIPIYYESAYGIWNKLEYFPKNMKDLADELRKIAKEDIDVENGDELIKWADELDQRAKKLDETYLFSWDDVPEKDNEQLLKFLRDDIKIEWTENAEIKKTDDNKIITIADRIDGKNSLKFKLDEKGGKVIFEIRGRKTHEYILKEEAGKINIYRKGIFCIRCGNKLVPYKNDENANVMAIGFVWIKKDVFAIKKKINEETKTEYKSLIRYEPHCNSAVCLSARLGAEASEELFKIATSEIVSRIKDMHSRIQNNG